MPTLRLLRVLVQPQLVLDYGTHLEEIEHAAVAIPATEWPTYSAERFPKEMAEWQARLDEEDK